MLALMMTAVLAQAPTVAPEPAAPALTIGSKAPTPELTKFLKGTAPNFFENDKTYILEFWATWCGPCRAGMPHISEVSEKYKDQGVFVVGISDEPESKVEPFLAKEEWQSKVRYNIAIDPDRSVHKQYMEAAGERGIPCAFIVKDGTVQWIGHPMSMDEPLAQIVAGTFDIATAAKARAEESANESRAMAQRAERTAAIRAGDWTKVFAMIDADANAAPAGAKADFDANKFLLMITRANMPKEGYSLGRSIVDSTENPMILNQLAWATATDPGVKERDLPFAILAAEKGVKVSGGKDAAILDTLARCYWDNGEKAKAVETQRKAVENAGDDEMGAEIRETLKKYETESKSVGSKT